MNSKSKILLGATSIALAMNMSCGTLNNEKTIAEKPNYVSKIVKHEDTKTPNYSISYAKFNGKKSITLDEKKIQVETENVNTKKLKEFNQLFAVIMQKQGNLENVSVDDFCKIRSLSIELITNTEFMMEKTYSNADSIGQIISRTRLEELNEKIKIIDEIEKNSLENEVVCFHKGYLIPTLIKLNSTVDKLTSNLSEKEICEINDNIISLKEMMEVSDNITQKLYIHELIKKMRGLLPKELQRINSQDLLDDCNIIEPTR